MVQQSVGSGLELSVFHPATDQDKQKSTDWGKGIRGRAQHLTSCSVLTGDVDHL